MLELGEASERFHRELTGPLAAANVDRVFLIGEAMTALYLVLPEQMRGGWWDSPEGSISALFRFLQPGDVVTVKGSHATHIDRVVERLRAQSTPSEA
jgi:UDP-N-acetylmuramoyl-tripeptide--D-alanyl-D-alanine ligase